VSRAGLSGTISKAGVVRYNAEPWMDTQEGFKPRSGAPHLKPAARPTDARPMQRNGRGGAVAAAVLAALALAGAGAAPAHAATGATRSSPGSSAPLALPFVFPRSLTQRPLVVVGGRVYRFQVDAIAALRAAEQSPTMIGIHRRLHPLVYTIQIWIGASPAPHWAVDFSYRGTVQAEVDVSRFGAVTAVWQGPLAVYLAGRGHYGGLFDSPYVVLVFSVMFLALFLNPRRLRRVGHADGLLLLGVFAIPYYLFDHAHFEASVLVVYPLLLLLAARMLWLGLRRAPGADRDAPAWPLPALAVGVLALVAARVVLDIVDRNVIDVGVASVIGAHAITHGQPLYAAALSHGDTYGPVAYLAYVPFEALWPWHGVWDYVPAAHAAAIFFDLATTIALAVLGMRMRADEAGRRLGLTLAWAWAAYPATLLGLLTNTNDGLVAFLFVLLLLVLRSPAGRGVVLGLAAAAKLFPVILLPLFALGWRKRPVRRALIVGGIFVLVVVAAFAAFVPSGGLNELYERTIGFQLGRFDVSSIWGLHPSLGWLKTIVEVAVGALGIGLAYLARDRSLAAVAALACALTVAVQLPAEHWFYNYLLWSAPFAFVALFAREASGRSLRSPARASSASRSERAVVAA